MPVISDFSTGACGYTGDERAEKPECGEATQRLAMSNRNKNQPFHPTGWTRVQKPGRGAGAGTTQKGRSVVRSNLPI